MKFKTRGPLTENDPVPYLLRPADLELETLVKKIDYVALIGPRLSGKTSMLVRLWHRLRQLPRYAVAYVNLSLYSTFAAERWYEAVYDALVASGAVPPPRGAVLEAIDFREEILQALRHALPPGQVLIVLLDEVETVPVALRTPFFATLREMFVSRAILTEFQRLTFVLAGSYVADDLIPDQTISPFRVAEKVYVEDATDITPLVAQLDRLERPMSQDVPPRIFEWTEGDVYLTQRLCERLEQRYPSGKLLPEAVDQVVQRYLLEDDLFNSLESRLRSQPPVLELIRSVIAQQTGLRFSRINHTVSHAWLLGCVKPNAYGNCLLRNAIYERILHDLLRRLPAEAARVKPVQPFIPTTAAREPEPLHGRYRLEATLRRGVLNQVYKATDLHSSLQVVVKQLMSGRDGDVIAWRRFLREGEVLRRLSHPHIVGLVDIFRQGDYNYIVMEYIEGGSVEQLLNQEGRQSLEQTLNILLGVADALRYLHEQGIVHRDLKPSNILVTHEISPRLADFGVARFLHETDRITVTNGVVGTPAYMSPESYQGAPLQPAEDVWSLGVTMYEMLTGTLPFTGRTHDHMRHAIQSDPIPNLREIRPDVPPAVTAVLYQMLERDTANRLIDGAAVHQALSSLRAQV